MNDFIRRFWFPAALIGLLLLTLPGMVLIFLNILGFHTTINNFTEENLGISYLPTIPGWGAVLLLLLPFLILLLYFLKLKRKPIQVPSTFLWKKSIEDLHVNSLLQWLRQNVLLLLQMLIVMVLTYAVLNIRFHGRTGGGRHYIIMVDNSASMSATDVNPSRLEWAKKEALKEIDAASDNDFGMVIVFNSNAQTVQSRTSDRNKLRQAVRSIKPTHRPTRIEDALSLADSMANPTRSAENLASKPEKEEPGKARTYDTPEGIPTTIHLWSDGRFPDVPGFTLGNLSLQYHCAGKFGPENVNNVGILALNARRQEEDASRIDVFVSAQNYGPEPVEARIELVVTVPDKATDRYVKKITLPARKVTEEKDPSSENKVVNETLEAASVTFELQDLDDTKEVVLHTQLLDANRHEPYKDDLEVDNEAWLVVGVVRKARVLIVGTSNDALDNFFKENVIGGVARIDRMTPDKLTTDDYRKPALNGDYDLVIFDRCAPPPGSKDDPQANMPRANTFFIGYPPPPWRMPDGSDADKDDPKTVEKGNQPSIRGWMQKHPVLKGLVALHEIQSDEFFKMKELPERTPKLFEGEKDMPLMLTLSRAPYTDLVLCFPILNDKDHYNSSWPLQVGFPLFLRNVLYAYGNIEDASAEETLKPGQVKVIRPDIPVDEIEVTPPHGERDKLLRGSRAEFSFGKTDEVGIYGIAWAGQPRRSFSVNLLDADESNIEPRTTLQVGAEKTTASNEKELSQPRDLWKYVVGLALILVLVEWYIYNRRVFV